MLKTQMREAFNHPSRGLVPVAGAGAVDVETNEINDLTTCM